MAENFESTLRSAFHRALRYRSSEPAPGPSDSLETLRRMLDVDLADSGREGRHVIAALADAVEPGLVGISSPDFYGWVMGASHPVGVAADWLTASWGQNAGIYHTSPAAAVAEEVVAAWILDLLGLPAQCGVGLVTGATMANFAALAAARTQVLEREGWDIEQDGLCGAPPVHVFLGEEAHISVHASLRYLGFGRRQIRPIAVDKQGRMQPEVLRRAMRAVAGPSIVIAQAGHINSGAFDPLAEIVEVARSHRAWVHVDGAFGLWIRAEPALAPLCSGVELADSWAVDGHKWLQIPYDCGFTIVRDAATLRQAMAKSASYLSAAPADGRCPSDYVPELSRRARGFAVWAVLQTLGRNGVAELVGRHCRCARRLGDLLAGEPGIEVLNDICLNQVALSFGSNDVTQAERDRLTRAVIDKVLGGNTAFVAGASWQGRWIMRVSVISLATEVEHIDALAALIIDSWRAVAH